ncbi:MAG: T9SS type A sorting domain-containing protein, partial [Mariniphaga sp.]
YRSADGISFTGFDDGLPAECAGVYHMVQKDDTVFTAVVADPLEKPLVYYTTGALSEWKLYDHTGIGDVLSDFQNNMKIFAASHSFFLSAPTDEAGFYRYDFAMLPEVSDTIDDYEYPPLETVDVSLKSLTVDNGNLSPTFAPNQLNYTVSLSGGTVTVPTVSAEANDAGADADVVQATNLTGTKAQRTATITVTGSDDTTTRTYTVEFSIALSSDATLSSLNPGQGTLTPAFSSSTLVYTVELPAGTTDVPTASATANDAGASVDITQATNLTGTQAERTAAIEVTAEDGISTNTYQIVYSVAPEPGKDANLASLTLDNGTLEPAFAAGIENYTATLPQGTTDVPVVSAETSDANAAKTINQATSLKGTETERTATVEVTSEDSTVTKTYSVVFSVESGTFINNTGETGIKTYPNPVSDMLTIHSSGMIQSVSIYDLGGKAVKQTMVAGNTATIDVSGLDAGMYLVGVRETSGKMIMNKIIKQ